jgi:hypothetical protein
MRTSEPKPETSAKQGTSKWPIRKRNQSRTKLQPTSQSLGMIPVTHIFRSTKTVCTRRRR